MAPRHSATPRWGQILEGPLEAASASKWWESIPEREHPGPRLGRSPELESTQSAWSAEARGRGEEQTGAPGTC